MKKRSLGLSLVDVHTHCGGMDLSNFYKFKYPTCQDIRDLDRKRIAANVDYQVVFPMPTTIYYDIPYYWCAHVFRPSGYCDYPFQIENERLLLEIESFRLERMLPFLAFSLQDKIDVQVASIQRLAARFPIYGLKLHTKVDQNTPAALETIGAQFLELAKALDVPILLHSTLETAYNGGRVLELAGRHPKIRFCAAHFGGFSRSFFHALSAYTGNNFFFDMAPTKLLCAFYNAVADRNDLVNLDYSSPEKVVRWLSEHFDRYMLWGTDAPWHAARMLHMGEQQAQPYSYEEEADLPRNLGLLNILSENTNRFLFNLSPHHSSSS